MTNPISSSSSSPIPPFQSSFYFFLPHHYLLMASSSSLPNSHSYFKPLNPNAHPFLYPPPPPSPPAFIPAAPVHVYYPRAPCFFQFDSYPALSSSGARILPLHQLGFGHEAFHIEKLSDMEFKPRISNLINREVGFSNNPRRKIETLKWVEKGKTSNDSVEKISQCSDNFTANGITTVMIKNIPNQLRRGDIMYLLDRYCLMVNKKREFQSDFTSSEYDFVYLPMDFRRFWDERRVSNLGYAFVNFTSSDAAFQFYRRYHNYKWDVNVNRKICEITAAKIQGREALKSAFKNKIFWCHSDHYLPVMLTPASDGNQLYKTMSLGKRIPRPPKKPLRKVCH